MNISLFEMEKTSIKIKLEGQPPLELQSPTKEVSEDLYTLSRDGFSCTIPGLGFEYHIPPFGKTHILVETPATAVGLREVVVYGVSCESEVKMTPDEVANRVFNVFGVNVQENLTALKPPEDDSISIVGDGESAYPCGTLFTSGTYSHSSTYSPLSPRPHTPPHLHAPTPSPRPLRLPLDNNTDSRLITPHSVATPNTSFQPNHALVSGVGSYNIPGDEALEDSAPASNCVRKVIETVQTQVHQTLGPVQKIQHQDLGGTMDTGAIILETPSSNVTRLTIRDVDASLPLSPLLFQSSSQESEPRLHSLPEQVGPTSSTDTKSCGNQLVVGIGQPRTITSSLKPNPSFGRQLSLPGEKREKTSLPILPRNASDACLKDQAEDLSMTQHQRRASLNLHVSACEQTIEELPKETPATPTKDTLTTPTEDMPATPTKETLGTPTKPMAIQRQESVVDSEQNEFVMPKPMVQKYFLHDHPPPTDTRIPVLTEQKLLMEFNNINKEVSSHSHSNRDPVMGGEAQVTCEGGDACDSGDDCRGSAINFQVAPSSDSSPSSLDRPEHISPKMQQVHLLEHAMNGYCLLKDTCKAGDHGNLEFTQAVEQMRAMVEEARDGKQDEDLKDYIRVHCGNCRDVNCKVPHRMAGCPPPGETFSSSDTGQTDSPQQSAYPYQESPDISFDEQVNQSTTSEYERHLAQAQGPPRPLSPLTYAQQTSDVEGIDFVSSQDQTAPFSPLLGSRKFHGSPLQMVPPGQSYIASPAMPKHFMPEQLRSGHMSPMGSTGFFVPGVNAPVRGQHQQESQLGAESYFHQVSDKGQADMKPREKGQYQYLEPSRSGSGFRKMYGVGENRQMSVKAGEFPSYQALHTKKPGALVYAAEGSDLIPGESYPCPQSVPDRDKLGKGGNGTVVKFPLGGTEYALKLTQYRENELNTWSQLRHRNVVPLLGVMMAEQSRFCYQFMPRMTGDLRSMMIDQGDLLTHLKKHPKEWDVVMENTLYILKEVTCGLCYLHSQNIQHSDLKAHNILIMKKCACPDILHCTCTGDDKYEVKIADFDSLKKTKFSRGAAQFPEICRDPMNDMDMNGVKGTPAYRAPEQFKKCPNRHSFKRTLEDGKDLFDMEGPWCDMWSLGVIVLQMVLGSHNKGPYISEASILTSCKADKMHPRVEATVATLRRSQLHSLALANPELKPLALIAEECLKVDFRMRSTAKAVLIILQDQLQTL